MGDSATDAQQLQAPPDESLRTERFEPAGDRIAPERQ
jgi:hypothetical protein